MIFRRTHVRSAQKLAKSEHGEVTKSAENGLEPLQGSTVTD